MMETAADGAPDQVNGNMLQQSLDTPDSEEEKDTQGQMYKKMANMALRSHTANTSSDDPYDSSEYSSDDNREHRTTTSAYINTYDGIHNAGFNTDSSDIEVLLDERNNSSDSIEVLEGAGDGVAWGGGLARQDTVVEQTTSEASEDHTRTQDSSDTATILSNSSASNLPTDDSKNSSPCNRKLSSSNDPGTQQVTTDADIHSKPSSDYHQFADCYASSHSSYGSPIHQAAGEQGAVDTDSPDSAPGNHRPDSLVLPKPLQFYERQRLTKKESTSSEVSSRSSSMDALLEDASNTPLSMHGHISREGDMVSFVAEGLTDMIKRSSPMSRSRTESSVSSWSVGRSGLHTPNSVSSSTSGWDSSASSVTGYSYSGLSRSASELTQSPDDIPPIDPRAVMELEGYAQQTAASLSHMMAALTSNLHKMSWLTRGCLGAYVAGVDNTCDTVDTSIKSMYALMAKCEELSTAMRPIYSLHENIKEMKRLVDLFEAQMNKYDKS